MSTKPKPDNPAVVEEERLVQALVARGLVAREEIKECRDARTEEQTGARGLLAELVRHTYLTPNQARRAYQNLETLLHQQIPGYQLLEKLGYGSMGTVYKALQVSMERLVAIKILKPKLASNPGYLQRFTREAHIAAKLSHSNIVQAIDVGSAGPLHYFVMEFVEGTNIKTELEAGKVYEEREALDIVLQVARALQHAHRKQMVHRDVKPANIIITRDGTVKLADLGLAHQEDDTDFAKTEKGMTIGTPYYIAPELIRGKHEADIRADIYSLGATLYHMVTGRTPFPYVKVNDVLKAHLTEELVPPDHLRATLSAGLGEVIELMMAKNRRERYQTPGELCIDLELLLRGEPPRLARQQAEFAVLEDLAQGDPEVEKPQTVTIELTQTKPEHNAWVVLLVIFLAASLLLNSVLLAYVL